MNKVILVGNLGADGELKVSQGGTSILKLRLATTERWKDRDGNKQERVEWHSISRFGKGAEALHPYMLKGKGLIVEGSIRTTSYEDRNGEKRYRTEIVSSNIEFAPGGGNGNGGGGQRSGGTTRAPARPDPDDNFPMDDDIPFDGAR